MTIEEFKERAKECSNIHACDIDDLCYDWLKSYFKENKDETSLKLLDIVIHNIK